jgi:alkylation response protein AidB-like acyl-CoA dehydrogenase
MPPSPEEAHDEVVAWLAANPWRGVDRHEWLVRVRDERWAVPTWPVAWFGRDWPRSSARVVSQAFAEAGAPGAGQDEMNLWANTALAFGSDDLKQRFIGPLLADELQFCLLYSEPGAGSDLAAVQTRAERDGDDWIVNGQKVWTSGAQVAEYGMLIARTDWDVPKHRGLTFFFLPMRQPGVEVRPLRQITGEQHFNEVFITDARVPDANRLSTPGDGWRVLQTALAYERALMGVADRAPGRARAPRARGHAPTVVDPVWESSTNLVALARALGRSDDPVIRQEIARVYSLRLVNAWNGQRATAALKQGTSSPLVSLGKLAMSRIVHESARVEAAVVAADALLAGEENPRGDAATFHALNAYFTSIGGGTDQIQRNIIGERVLGLPKEPDVDRDLPFRDVRKA